MPNLQIFYLRRHIFKSFLSQNNPFICMTSLDCGKRRVLIDLILTLNASFQDYDFSEVRPHHFLRIKPTEVIASINERLNEVAVNGSSTRNTRANFLQMLWTSIDEVIVLDECEVYSFLLPPDGDGDDYQFLLSDEDNDCNEDHHLLWSFNFFFYNRSMKRMVFFTCTESSLLPACDAMEEDSNVGQYYFPRGSTDDDQMDASDGYFSKWQRHQYSVDDPDELYGFDMEAGQSDTPDFVV
mmetsp:Transcript_39254/g.91579  ORF Transcript_39254/g.91579 Transcript_39254/m.91579 type:complete len:240 (-) Transcript_39254:223-942(-)